MRAGKRLIIAVLISALQLAYGQPEGDDHGRVVVRDTLLKLYTSTGGLSWTLSQPDGAWGTSPDPCKWQGVVCCSASNSSSSVSQAPLSYTVFQVSRPCSRPGEPRALLLSGANLSGTLPPELSGLPLQVIALSDNPALRGELPPGLLQLEDLVEIDVRNTSLSCPTAVAADAGGNGPVTGSEAAPGCRLPVQFQGSAASMPFTSAAAVGTDTSGALALEPLGSRFSCPVLAYRTLSSSNTSSNGSSSTAASAGPAGSAASGASQAEGPYSTAAATDLSLIPSGALAPAGAALLLADPAFWLFQMCLCLQLPGDVPASLTTPALVRGQGSEGLRAVCGPAEAFAATAGGRNTVNLSAADLAGIIIGVGLGTALLAGASVALCCARRELRLRRRHRRLRIPRVPPYGVKPGGAGAPAGPGDAPATWLQVLREWFVERQYSLMSDDRNRPLGYGLTGVGLRRLSEDVSPPAARKNMPGSEFEAKRARPPGTLSDSFGSEVTLVATDVEGSTELWEWQPDVMNNALALHDRLVRLTLAACCGYEVMTEGDAFLVAFHEPVDAVRWALLLQSALLKLDWPPLLLEHPLCRPRPLVPTAAPPGTAAAADGANDAPLLVLFKGLAVRMGIATGVPSAVREHPITRRMQYTGAVLRLATGIAELGSGGQVLLEPLTFKGIHNKFEELDVEESEVQELTDLIRVQYWEGSFEQYQLMEAPTFTESPAAPPQATNAPQHPQPHQGQQQQQAQQQQQQQPPSHSHPYQASMQGKQSHASTPPATPHMPYLLEDPAGGGDGRPTATTAAAANHAQVLSEKLPQPVRGPRRYGNVRRGQSAAALIRRDSFRTAPLKQASTSNFSTGRPSAAAAAAAGVPLPLPPPHHHHHLHLHHQHPHHQHLSSAGLMLNSRRSLVPGGHRGSFGGPPFMAPVAGLARIERSALEAAAAPGLGGSIIGAPLGPGGSATGPGAHVVVDAAPLVSSVSSAAALAEEGNGGSISAFTTAHQRAPPPPPPQRQLQLQQQQQFPLAASVPAEPGGRGYGGSGGGQQRTPPPWLADTAQRSAGAVDEAINAGAGAGTGVGAGAGAGPPVVPPGPDAPGLTPELTLRARLPSPAGWQRPSQQLPLPGLVQPPGNPTDSPAAAPLPSAHINISSAYRHLSSLPSFEMLGTSSNGNGVYAGAPAPASAPALAAAPQAYRPLPSHPFAVIPLAACGGDNPALPRPAELAALAGSLYPDVPDVQQQSSPSGAPSTAGVDAPAARCLTGARGVAVSPVAEVGAAAPAPAPGPAPEAASSRPWLAAVSAPPVPYSVQDLQAAGGARAPRAPPPGLRRGAGGAEAGAGVDADGPHSGPGAIAEATEVGPGWAGRGPAAAGSGNGAQERRFSDPEVNVSCTDGEDSGSSFGVAGAAARTSSYRPAAAAPIAGPAALGFKTAAAAAAAQRPPFLGRSSASTSQITQLQLLHPHPQPHPQPSLHWDQSSASRTSGSPAESPLLAQTAPPLAPYSSAGAAPSNGCAGAAGPSAPHPGTGSVGANGVRPSAATGHPPAASGGPSDSGSRHGPPASVSVSVSSDRSLRRSPSHMVASNYQLHRLASMSTAASHGPSAAGGTDAAAAAATAAAGAIGGASSSACGGPASQGTLHGSGSHSAGSFGSPAGIIGGIGAGGAGGAAPVVPPTHGAASSLGSVGNLHGSRLSARGPPPRSHGQLNFLAGSWAEPPLPLPPQPQPQPQQQYSGFPSFPSTGAGGGFTGGGEDGNPGFERTSSGVPPLCNSPSLSMPYPVHVSALGAAVQSSCNLTLLQPQPQQPPQLPPQVPPHARCLYPYLHHLPTGQLQQYPAQSTYPPVQQPGPGLREFLYDSWRRAVIAGYDDSSVPAAPACVSAAMNWIVAGGSVDQKRQTPAPPSGAAGPAYPPGRSSLDRCGTVGASLGGRGTGALNLLDHGLDQELSGTLPGPGTLQGMGMSVGAGAGMVAGPAVGEHGPTGPGAVGWQRSDVDLSDCLEDAGEAREAAAPGLGFGRDVSTRGGAVFARHSMRNIIMDATNASAGSIGAEVFVGAAGGCGGAAGGTAPPGPRLLALRSTMGLQAMGSTANRAAKEALDLSNAACADSDDISMISSTHATSPTSPVGTGARDRHRHGSPRHTTTCAHHPRGLLLDLLQRLPSRQALELTGRSRRAMPPRADSGGGTPCGAGSAAAAGAAAGSGDEEAAGTNPGGDSTARAGAAAAAAPVLTAARSAGSVRSSGSFGRDGREGRDSAGQAAAAAAGGGAGGPVVAPEAAQALGAATAASAAKAPAATVPVTTAVGPLVGAAAATTSTAAAAAAAAGGSLSAAAAWTATASAPATQKFAIQGLGPLAPCEDATVGITCSPEFAAPAADSEGGAAAAAATAAAKGTPRSESSTGTRSKDRPGGSKRAFIKSISVRRANRGSLSPTETPARTLSRLRFRAVTSAAKDPPPVPTSVPHSHSLIVIDMGVHRLKISALGAAYGDLYDGVQVIQLLPEHLKHRAAYHPPLKSQAQLSPGFFDAPGGNQALLPCAPGQSPSFPRLSLMFIQPAGYSAVANASLEVAERSGAVFATAVREVLQVFGAYECQEYECTFMVACEGPRVAAEVALALHEWLLHADWPTDLLEEHPEGRILLAPDGRPLLRGFRAKVGIFTGVPLSVVPHATTGRADYFGALVNRAARLMAGAKAGQTLIDKPSGAEVLKEWRQRAAAHARSTQPQLQPHAPAPALSSPSRHPGTEPEDGVPVRAYSALRPGQASGTTSPTLDHLSICSVAQYPAATVRLNIPPISTAGPNGCGGSVAAAPPPHLPKFPAISPTAAAAAGAAIAPSGFGAGRPGVAPYATKSSASLSAVEALALPVGPLIGGPSRRIPARNSFRVTLPIDNRDRDRDRDPDGPAAVEAAAGEPPLPLPPQSQSQSQSQSQLLPPHAARPALPTAFAPPSLVLPTLPSPAPSYMSGLSTASPRQPSSPLGPGPSAASHIPSSTIEAAMAGAQPATPAAAAPAALEAPDPDPLYATLDGLVARPSSPPNPTTFSLTPPLMLPVVPVSPARSPARPLLARPPAVQSVHSAQALAGAGAGGGTGTGPSALSGPIVGVPNPAPDWFGALATDRMHDELASKVQAVQATVQVHDLGLFRLKGLAEGQPVIALQLKRLAAAGIGASGTAAAGAPGMGGEGSAHRGKERAGGQAGEGMGPNASGGGVGGGKEAGGGGGLGNKAEQLLAGSGLIEEVMVVLPMQLRSVHALAGEV